MNSDLKCLNEWFKANKLSLNASKTNYILFRNKNVIYEDEHALTMENTILSRSESVIFLGLRIDEFLNWNAQTKHIVKKLSSCLYILNSVKNFLSASTLKTIYHSLFESYLRYGILLWSNTNKKNLNFIIKSQKKSSTDYK